MVTLQEISAIGAVLSVLFILLTYLWSEMDSPREIEQQLRGRLETKSAGQDDLTIKFNVIRVHESDSLWDGVRKHITLQPIGRTKAQVSFESGDVDSEFDLNREEFEKLASDLGIDAEYEVTEINETEQRAYVELTMETLKERPVYELLVGLEDVVN